MNSEGSLRDGGFRGRSGGPWSQRHGGASGRAVSTAPATCSRCGYEQHLSGERCPAADATCHRCNRKGHFSYKSFSKTTASAPIAEVDYSLPETAFLDAVNDGNVSS